MAQIKFSAKDELLWVKVRDGDRVVKFDNLVSWNVLEEENRAVFFNDARDAVVSIPLCRRTRKALGI